MCLDGVAGYPQELAHGYPLNRKRSRDSARNRGGLRSGAHCSTHGAMAGEASRDRRAATTWPFGQLLSAGCSARLTLCDRTHESVS